MSLPLLFALVVAQGQTTPPTGASAGTSVQQSPATQAAAPAPQPFSSAFVIAEPNRIALTPRIDGKMDDEEWDPLSSSPDLKSFFQWEPGKFHIAAIVPNGHDIITSIDLKANGWLIGKDNLEIRLSNATGTAVVTARIMDGTGIDGPKWIDVPGFSISSQAASSTDGTNTTFEATIADTGLGLIPTATGTKLMLRVDAPLSTDPVAPAYLPRSLAPVTLVLQRSVALPPGLAFNPEGIGRTSIAGDSTHIRLGFNGSNSMKLQRLEMHSEGFAKNDTNQLAVPFPKFDDRGRSYMDYNSGIADGSPEGYRVLKGTLTTSDNISAVLECSYRVGPLVDFEIPRISIPLSKTDRSVKVGINIKSNAPKRVTGTLTIVAPDPLRVLNGADRKIAIFTNRGQDRDDFELFVPVNTAGTYPIRFVATINGKKFEQVRYITVGGL
jgi:hypothetical protein